MKKTIIWIVIILLIIFGFYSVSNKDGKVKEPIKIGFVAPLSGDGASYGETERRATEMVVEEINKNGGINGQIVEVIYEDGKCVGKDALTAVNKLIDFDKVKIIFGGLCSSETLAMVPVTEKNKVVLFSSFSSSPNLAKAGEYFFRNAPSDSDVAKTDADAMVKLGYKKLAIISENNDYGLGVKSVMKTSLENTDLKIVADEDFGSNTNDYRNHIAKITSVKPDVIYVNPGSSGKAGGLIVKQLRESGYKGAIHGNFSLGTPDALSAGGDSLNGVIVGDSVESSDMLKKLAEQYQNKYNAKPANDFEFGASYDRSKIVLGAVKEVGYDAEKVRNYIKDIKEYDGAVGKYHFDEYGNVAGGVFYTNYRLMDGVKKPL